jgi:hypothetical protein
MIISRFRVDDFDLSLKITFSKNYIIFKKLHHFQKITLFSKNYIIFKKLHHFQKIALSKNYVLKISHVLCYSNCVHVINSGALVHTIKKVFSKIDMMTNLRKNKNETANHHRFEKWYRNAVNAVNAVNRCHL